MKDFWLSCGHHFTDRDGDGRLLITPDFLRAYMARPELSPPPQACDAERRLHATLLANPHASVGMAEIAAIVDADARENWQLMIAFRDRLLCNKTIEAGYIDLVRNSAGTTPPLFFNQLVHVILRNVLDGCSDPFVIRAAEIFFRPQRLAIQEGALIAADDEMIIGSGPAPLSPLATSLATLAGDQIDVLNDKNAENYWERSDLFDTALDLTVGRRGAASIGTVIELWVRHMLSIDVEVEPIGELRDAPFTWYIGLDAEGTRVGDTLWRGKELDEALRHQVAGLFRLTIPSADDGVVYLILAMTGDRVVRMKPQNLLTGLPVQAREPLT